MREQEMKLEKVKKSCQTAKSVTKVMQIILVVGCILCLVGAAIVFAMRDSVNAAIAANEASVSFKNITANGIIGLDVDVADFIAEGMYAEVCMIYCIVGAVYTFFCSIIFRMISKVFVIIEQSETPFSDEVVKKLKKAFIVIVVVTGLFVGVGTALLTALFLWCIYCILDYGITLQAEVDETL